MRYAVRLAVLFTSMLLSMLLFLGAASADETYKFPNGVSFSYPRGYQKQEVNQPPMTTVTLMNASDTAVNFAVSLIKGGVASGQSIPDDIDEPGFKSSLPKGTEVIAYKKITVGGKSALLAESAAEQQGMYIFSRVVTIISGEDVISVAATVMGKNKVDAGRKTAEAIEASLKF
jgi:hypothetical protein